MMELKLVKLKYLIQKLDSDVAIYINGKQYTKELSEKMLETEITKIDIETKNVVGNDLESLGYSFEVGV